jgi:glycosyltransferase involved in cell wall biosynthesis
VRVTAVIPTIDEEATVAEVVRGCREHVEDVVVVDGGSRDSTTRVAAAAGARVVRLERRGKGFALRHAIAHEEADALVFVDADGSHEPGDIPALVAPIAEGRADLVIASRATGGSDELGRDVGHLIRGLGSRAILAAVNRRFGVDLSDIQNGFRALRTDVARGLGLREAGFCIEQEMAVKCLGDGRRVLNVPSHEFPRRHGRSRLCLWTAWPRFAWSAAVLLLGPTPRREGRA